LIREGHLEGHSRWGVVHGHFEGVSYRRDLSLDHDLVVYFEVVDFQRSVYFRIPLDEKNKDNQLRRYADEFRTNLRSAADLCPG